jgi:predicted nucleic acid-binding protein
MFLLDTNVISESRKLHSGKADENVVRWLRATSPAQTFLSVFTVFELELGVRLKERQDAAQGQDTAALARNHSSAGVCGQGARTRRGWRPAMRSAACARSCQ